eukprot:TRINITY_DN122763_c0_g1_i1.p1 TRINITY_DN122763_c0_g1~~TRINITY_DN122763_c0_g1_i1.p1  ORF type:complete len:747 (+),score=185.84 TRINITY_DN122763_c0_g1_i1:172-2412(+)
MSATAALSNAPIDASETNSFRNVALELSELTNAAVHAMLQLDEQLARERTQLQSERQELEAKRAEQKGMLPGATTLLPGETMNEDYPSIEAVDAFRPSPTAAAGVAALHQELHGARVQIEALTQRMQEIELTKEEAIAKSGAEPESNGNGHCEEPARHDAKNVGFAKQVTEADEPLSPVIEVATSYELTQMSLCWQSVSKAAKSTRLFPAASVFQRESQLYVLASQLRRGGGDLLLGPKGRKITVESAKTGPELSSVVRIKIGEESALVPAEQMLLVQEHDKSIKPVVAEQLLRWPGPLPRIGDGNHWHNIVAVERMQERCPTIEVVLSETAEPLPLLVWSECPFGCPAPRSEVEAIQRRIIKAKTALLCENVMEIGDNACCWVSASSSDGAARLFPQETVFRSEYGLWTRAKDLVQGTAIQKEGASLSGPCGATTKVLSAKMQPGRTDLLRLRCSYGNMLVPGEHEVKVEGAADEEAAKTIQAGAYRTWPGMFPRIHDGQVYHIVDLVESFTEVTPMVEILLEDNIDVLAWTDYPDTGSVAVDPANAAGGKTLLEGAASRQTSPGSTSLDKKAKQKRTKKLDEDGMGAWVSAADLGSDKRVFLSETCFKLDSGKLVRAGQLVELLASKGDGKPVLLQGLKNALCSVTSAIAGDPDENHAVSRVRTCGGAIMAVPNQRILVEGADGRPTTAKIGELRGWPGPLPRLYNGAVFNQMDLVEAATVQTKLITLQFQDPRSSLFAWSPPC